MPRPTRPTSPQKPSRSRLLSAIHIKRQRLRIPDPEYRDFLWETFEVVSSADLNEEGLHELLRRLDRWTHPQAAMEKTSRLRYSKGLEALANTRNVMAEKQKAYEHLADVVENALDMEKLYQIMGEKTC